MPRGLSDSQVSICGPVKEFGNRIRKYWSHNRANQQEEVACSKDLPTPRRQRAIQQRAWVPMAGWERWELPDQALVSTWAEKCVRDRLSWQDVSVSDITAWATTPNPWQLPSEKAASLGDESGRTELNYNWYEIEVPTDLFWYHQFIMPSVLLSRDCQPKYFHLSLKLQELKDEFIVSSQSSSSMNPRTPSHQWLDDPGHITLKLA